jgi:hypothetical protein
VTPQVGDIWEWTDLAEVKSYWLLIEELNRPSKFSHAKFFYALGLNSGNNSKIVFQDEERWRKVS